MKKIIFGLLVAFVALSFMGCPNTYEEYGYDTPVCYYVGDSTGWSFEKMEYDWDSLKNVIEVEVAAGNTFKITSSPDWTGTEWNNANLDKACENADFLDAPVEEYGKYKTCFKSSIKNKNFLLLQLVT